MQITAKQKSLFYLIISLISLMLLITSLSVHLITFWNVNLQERFPYVFLLHIGIFVLIAPILLLQKIEEKREDEKIITLRDGFDEVENPVKESEDKSYPSNKFIVAYVLIGFYAMLNFMIFGLGAKGSPMIIDEKYVLRIHGQSDQEISKQEYDIASAQLLRGFSGHWIVFYFYFTTFAFFHFKNPDEK